MNLTVDEWAQSPKHNSKYEDWAGHCACLVFPLQ